MGAAVSIIGICVDGIRRIDTGITGIGSSGIVGFRRKLLSM